MRGDRGQLTLACNSVGLVIEMQILFVALSTMLIKHFLDEFNCSSSVAIFNGIMPIFVEPLNTRKQSFAGPIFSLYSFGLALTILIKAISPALTISNAIGEIEVNSMSIAEMFSVVVF